MLSPDRLTMKSQEALADAATRARQAGNPQVHDTHLLAALLAQGEGIVVPILQKLGVAIPALQGALDRELARYPKQSDAQPTASRELSAVLEAAEREAQELGDAYVSTEHLLIALAETKGAESAALLKEQRATKAALREALTAVRGAHRVTDQSPETQYQALEKYTRDLTPTRGRESSIR